MASKKVFAVCLALLAVCNFGILGQEQDFGKPCSDVYNQSRIYCYGDFLLTVQRAKLYTDQKTFVDLPLKNNPFFVLDEFEKLGIKGENLDEGQRQRLEQFIDEHFDKNGTEFEPWDPSDWEENPAFLKEIANEDLRKFASDLHKFWKELGRKIKEDVKTNSERHSMLYVSHPVIVPGGRFKEFYYWDSYWIQRGLLVSGMTETVKGMIENFFEMVEELGFIPNGGRIYYQRTQPPLLLPMVDSYYEVTGDLGFIEANIKTMITEFEFFMNKRMVNVTSEEGIEHRMARYNVELTDPRPESFSEDYEIIHSQELTPVEEQNLYANLKSGAESGWDFSSRWFVLDDNVSPTQGNLSHSKTRDIIPVDLNSFLYWNAVLLDKYCTLVANTTLCDPAEYQFKQKAEDMKLAIKDVLWDEDEGTWFDFDFVRGRKRRNFFPTNVAPLWTNAFHDDADIIAKKTVLYLQNTGAINYPGGIPTTMLQTGQQWDFPNAWAPLQHLVVEALQNSGEPSAQELAFNLAEKWIQSNHLSYLQTEAMFEKYDATIVGAAGSGGEYEVVIGFGWSNGVVLDFFKKYGSRLKPVDNLPTPPGDESAAISVNVHAAWMVATSAIVLLCKNILL